MIDRALDELDAATVEGRPPDYSRLMRLQALDLVKIGNAFTADTLRRMENENDGGGSGPVSLDPPSSS